MSDRELQFVVEIIKQLNSRLKIEIKLLTSFHSQIDEQTEHMKSGVGTISLILCRP